MRAAACCCLLVCFLGLTGCSAFGKKSNSKPNSPPQEPAGLGWPPQSGGSSSPTAERSAVPAGSSILAGRVIDSYDRSPPASFIQVVAAKDALGNQPAPIEVATDANGYFTIHGLKSGLHYQLIARTKGDAGPKLAGTKWAIPPNPRLLIYMSENFATENVPPAPDAPAVPGPKSTPSSGNTDKSGKDAQREPAKSTGSPTTRGIQIGTPIPLDGGPNAPTNFDPNLRTQNIVANPDGFARNTPPASIPPQPIFNRVDPTTPATAFVPPVAIGPARVPSCVLTGRQLENFALNDVNGRAWEFRGQPHKLVLLDFWGPWCMPCLASIPHLRILQDNFGKQGLEVIGIAYEQEPMSQAAQIRRVQNIRDRLQINYRLLLGSDISTCPVRNQFTVSRFPTLVLIDENRRIIWRQEGADEYKMQELAQLIRQQLRVK